MIKTAMVAEETNEFAHTTLLFCAKFVSSFEGNETHALLADICRWLLTVSFLQCEIQYLFMNNFCRLFQIIHTSAFVSVNLLI